MNTMQKTRQQEMRAAGVLENESKMKAKAALEAYNRRIATEKKRQGFMVRKHEEEKTNEMHRI